VTSCIVDSAAIYIMVVKFRNTIWPPSPQLSLHRRATLSSYSNGTRSVHSRVNPKRSLYCEMSVNVPNCVAGSFLRVHLAAGRVFCFLQLSQVLRAEDSPTRRNWVGSFFLFLIFFQYSMLRYCALGCLAKLISIRNIRN
jgi:hypothetical protein